MVLKEKYSDHPELLAKFYVFQKQMRYTKTI